MATSLYKNVATEQLHAVYKHPDFTDQQSIPSYKKNQTIINNPQHKSTQSIYADDYPLVLERVLKKYPVAITTLGHFSVYKDGQVNPTQNNCQHKPAELLKILIALGSRSVGEVRINDALWPDADGDVAR